MKTYKELDEMFIEFVFLSYQCENYLAVDGLSIFHKLISSSILNGILGKLLFRTG